MQITTFNPMILSPKADEVIALFEELGFEKHHTPVTQTETAQIQSTRMEDANDNHVDVADLKNIPQDIMFIRMNVDDFEEAYNILVAHGFKNTRGDSSIETKSSKAATMVSPSGFTISLVQHIRKVDK